MWVQLLWLSTSSSSIAQKVYPLYSFIQPRRISSSRFHLNPSIIQRNQGPKFETVIYIVSSNPLFIDKLMPFIPTIVKPAKFITLCCENQIEKNLASLLPRDGTEVFCQTASVCGRHYCLSVKHSQTNNQSTVKLCRRPGK